MLSILGDKMPAPVNLTEITIPDSKLCQKATRLVEQVSSKCLCNHCMRTYFFGELLGQREGLKYDRELFYVAAVLHDLGLTDTFRGEQRFEVDGADAAKKFVLENGLSESQSEVVWDAIALHTSIGIASRKQPEIALVHLGAGVDVLGLALEDLETSTVEQILENYPRLNFKQDFLDVLLVDIKQKMPHAIPLTWMAEVGRTEIANFICPTFVDLFKNSPFSE